MTNKELKQLDTLLDIKLAEMLDECIKRFTDEVIRSYGLGNIKEIIYERMKSAEIHEVKITLTDIIREELSDINYQPQDDDTRRE